MTSEPEFVAAARIDQNLCNSSNMEIQENGHLKAPMVPNVTKIEINLFDKKATERWRRIRDDS